MAQHQKSQQPHGSLFQKNAPLPSQGGGQINELGKRIRSVEQRISTIQRQLQVNEQSMIMNERKDVTDVKSLRQEMKDIRKDIDSSPVCHRKNHFCDALASCFSQSNI